MRTSPPETGPRPRLKTSKSAPLDHIPHPHKRSGRHLGAAVRIDQAFHNMTKAARDIATLALTGLVIGIMLGILIAGGYATWAVGGDLANIGFGTIFAFASFSLGAVTELFRTAVMVGGAVALTVTVVAPAIGFRRELTSHGSARWATTAETRQAGLRAPLRKIMGRIYGKLGGQQRTLRPVRHARPDCRTTPSVTAPFSALTWNSAGDGDGDG